MAMDGKVFQCAWNLLAVVVGDDVGGVDGLGLGESGRTGHYVTMRLDQVHFELLSKHPVH